MQKAVIYTRVSTEEQTHGYSLENQRELCIKRARELGIVDWKVYEEAGISGEVQNRPALLDAIAYATSDKDVKYFICYDPDRFSRDLPLLLAFTEQIERTKRVEVVYVNFTKENTPEGVFMYQVRGAVAQLEKELIKRRTTTGKIRKARQGGWTHWPGIYGYNYDKGTVTINEKQATVIRMMFSYAAEMGVNAIADRLALMGVPSPRANSNIWSKSTIRRIIQNESYYTGKTYIRTTDTAKTHLNKYVKNKEEKAQRTTRPKEEWVQMSVPPIVDEDTFNRAQRKIETARRQSEENIHYHFLLSGLLRCGVCGKTWHGFSGMRQQQRISYYVCTNKSPGPRKGSGIERCPTNFIHTHEFDDICWNLVLGWLTDDEKILQFQEQKKDQMSNRQKSEEIKLLQARYEKLNVEENNLITLYRHEDNTRIKEKLKTEMDQIALELDRISATLDETRKSEEENALTSEVNREVIQKYREKYPNVDNLGWREKYDIIHDLVNSIIVEKEETNYRLVFTPKH